MVFQDVVDQGSFVGAAKLRDVDPGQVTKQIKALEKRLNAVLLNRSIRSLSLTEIGEKVYVRAQQIKVLLNEISEIPGEYQQKVQGIIRVTSLSYVGRHFVEGAIADLQKEYPDVRVELEVSDGQSDIIKDGYDVAIRQWQPKESNLIATRLRDVQLRLVASPKFVKQHGNPASVSELLKLPASVYYRRDLMRDKLQYFNVDQNLVTEKLNGFFMVNDADLMLKSALAGNTFCIMADYMVEDYLTSGELVRLLPKLTMPFEYSIYAVYPHRSATKGTRLFIEYLKNRL